MNQNRKSRAESEEALQTAEFTCLSQHAEGILMGMSAELSHDDAGVETNDFQEELCDKLHSWAKRRNEDHNRDIGECSRSRTKD